jgi:hypothetical protein
MLTSFITFNSDMFCNPAIASWTSKHCAALAGYLRRSEYHRLMHASCMVVVVLRPSDVLLLRAAALQECGGGCQHRAPDT